MQTKEVRTDDSPIHSLARGMGLYQLARLHKVKGGGYSKYFSEFIFAPSSLSLEHTQKKRDKLPVTREHENCWLSFWSQEQSKLPNVYDLVNASF
jgi:hypothetical protein